MYGDYIYSIKINENCTKIENKEKKKKIEMQEHLNVFHEDKYRGNHTQITLNLTEQTFITSWNVMYKFHMVVDMLQYHLHLGIGCSNRY